MDNLEEGALQMDNLGKKRGADKIFIAVTRKQRGGGGFLPTLGHPFVIQLLAGVCTWPEQPGINCRHVLSRRER